MNDQDLLVAVETIVKTQIAEKIADNNIILETKMKQMADNAATSAAGIVMEQMQSQFKVLGEALQTIIENTSNHEPRITRVENQVAVHELAIKRHFR